MNELDRHKYTEADVVKFFRGFIQQGSKHKLFISYYHKDDEYWRNRFEELFGHLFINKSIKSGEIDTDVSTEYIKRLIQQDYILDISILVVFVGKKTYCRKHIDWEISAALRKKVGDYSGLLGICLPTHPDYEKANCNSDLVPPRLVDNITSGYAQFYDWTEKENTIKKWIEEAFNARKEKNCLIKNSRLQFRHNRCE